MQNQVFNTLRSRVLIAMLAIGSFSLSISSCVTSVGLSYQNYTPPAWAPPYDNVSAIHYYYFPDYDMYYDTWDGQFWYLDNGVWAYSIGLPPIYAGIDLYSSYIVLIDSRQIRPWEHNDFYKTNYPVHSYDNYKDIVVNNRIVTNIAANHELVPRAYNENNKRVTFMQRAKDHPAGKPQPQYHHVSHEVPIQNIKPYMPPASRSFNYGGRGRSH